LSEAQSTGLFFHNATARYLTACHRFFWPSCGPDKSRRPINHLRLARQLIPACKTSLTLRGPGSSEGAI
jgi:hypothetical protein